MSLRRVSAGKILAILGAAVALVAVTLYAWILAIESRKWKELEQTLIALEDEAQSRPGQRPVLTGEPTTGNAWAHYQRAMDYFKGKRLTLLGEFVVRAPKVDRDQVLALIEQLAPAVEDLRKGARCGSAKRAIDWRTTGQSTLASQHLALLAAGQARIWADAGRIHDAVELLLDGARAGADVGANGDGINGMISMAMVSLSFDELKEFISDRAVGKEDLLAIDEGLDRLDRSFPDPATCLVNGVMATGWELRGAESLQEYVNTLQREKQKISTWRFAFSERLLIVDYVEVELARSRRLRATEEQPWAEARGIVEEVVKNPLGQAVGVFGHVSYLATFRGRRAQLRLLRVAARHRATGEILDLDDPFGTKLGHEAKEGRLKFWSVARDGVDDGGTGEWRPQTGKDIVLEMKR